MLRTKPVSVGSHFATVVALAVVIVGCDSSADPATTTVEVSPPTATVESTKPAAPTTVAPTTVSPTTTEATVPPTTSVEDELVEALSRAQAASRNCYKTAPEPCDVKEIEDAYVGVQREVVIDIAGSGSTYENVDALRWTIMVGPTLRSEDLAVATVCRFDPVVVKYKDGTVNDDEGYFIQEWSLLPVGGGWKVSEVVNLSENPLETAPCDE